jgi:hypothetical protein
VSRSSAIAVLQDRHGTVGTRALMNESTSLVLVVGGEIAETEDGTTLRKAGATVLAGVRQAADEAKRRLKGETA